MSQHLIDNVAVGWSALGTDLLDSAPDALRDELTDGQHFPSSTLKDVLWDGSPAERITVTEKTTSGLDWGYVLHPHGIEIISLLEESHGPVVDWNTDPRARFSDSHVLWKPGRPIPATAPPLATQPSAPPTAPATHPVTATRSTARR
jgi:hypothetical protein